jgi:3-methylfumaryl-CoA hydratase
MAEVDIASWIGRSEALTDIAASGPLERLGALLDHDAAPWVAGQVPPLAYWLYFLPNARQSDVDVDGHPKRGGDGLLPPIALPRRMWAGSRVTFEAPIPVGAAIAKTSTVASIQAKTGASGEMVFVTVRHEISAEGVLCAVEEQDLVYRGPAPAAPAAAAPAKPPASPAEALRSRTLVADPVQLFRFSALTYNSHRIHYDRDYAKGEEGYPGLVVHGPYLATLLMDHFLRGQPGAAVKSFSFRAMKPAFDGSPITLNHGRTDEGDLLWVADAEGFTCMSAKVVVR